MNRVSYSIDWVGNPLGASVSRRGAISKYGSTFEAVGAAPLLGAMHRSICSTTYAMKDATTPSLPPAAVNAARSASFTAATNAVRRPGWLVLIPTFAATHFTLAWALVPPIYYILRQTNLSNALLAGPQGAWFLSQKVPSWVPDSLVDGVVGGGSDSDKDGAAPHQQHHQQLTIEQVLERLARRGIHLGWTYGGAAVKSLRQLQSGDTEAVAKEAVRKIGGDSGSSGANGRGQSMEEHTRSIKDRVLGYTSRHARSAADEIQFAHIRDGVAAWVLVKLLLPIRLPVSLFMTPRVARTLVRAFGRS